MYHWFKISGYATRADILVLFKVHTAKLGSLLTLKFYIVLKLGIIIGVGRRWQGACCCDVKTLKRRDCQRIRDDVIRVCAHQVMCDVTAQTTLQ